MTWVILTGKANDIDQAQTPHKVITIRDYLTHPNLFRGQRPKIINLAASYAYQSRGYYASLLASSRGHRVIPSVETMIDLSEPKLYDNALPDLEQALNASRKAIEPFEATRIRFFFGIGPSKGWERFGRLLFDWFRAPSLEVVIEPGEWIRIRRIGSPVIRQQIVARHRRRSGDTHIRRCGARRGCRRFSRFRTSDPGRLRCRGRRIRCGGFDRRRSFDNRPRPRFRGRREIHGQKDCRRKQHRQPETHLSNPFVQHGQTRMPHTACPA